MDTRLKNIAKPEFAYHIKLKNGEIVQPEPSHGIYTLRCPDCGTNHGNYDILVTASLRTAFGKVVHVAEDTLYMSESSLVICRECGRTGQMHEF
jgi:ribosomal protein S27E